MPIPSQIIATEPLNKDLMSRLMPKRRMLGETRHIYHYYRPSPDGERALVSAETGAVQSAPVYERSALRAGQAISGPAVIVETDTATIVSASFSARVHAAGHVILERTP